MTNITQWEGLQIVAQAREARGYDSILPDGRPGESLDEEIAFVRQGHWIPGMQTKLQGRQSPAEEIAELFQ